MSVHGPFVPLPPAPSGPPPGSRETGWTGFALGLRAGGAVLAVVVIAWALFKLLLFRLVMSVDPGLESDFPTLYDDPSLGEYLRGSTLLGDALVLTLLLMADQVTRVVRRGLRGTWDAPGPRARVLLCAHAALLGAAVLWLVHPVMWGTTIYL